MWVVEYSKSQGCYHIDEENQLIGSEAEAFLRTGWVGDYEVLGRFETMQEAQDFCRKIRTLEGS